MVSTTLALSLDLSSGPIEKERMSLFVCMIPVKPYLHYGV